MPPRACLFVEQSRSQMIEVHAGVQNNMKSYFIQNKVSKGAKIRNRYIQVQHLTQDTNGKVTNSQLDTTRSEVCIETVLVSK